MRPMRFRKVKTIEVIVREVILQEAYKNKNKVRLVFKEGMKTYEINYEDASEIMSLIEFIRINKNRITSILTASLKKEYEEVKVIF